MDTQQVSDKPKAFTLTREEWIRKRKAVMYNKRKLPDNRPTCPQCHCFYQYDRELGYHCERCNKYENDKAKTFHETYDRECLNFSSCRVKFKSKNKHERLCYKCKNGFERKECDMGWLGESDYF